LTSKRTSATKEEFDKNTKRDFHQRIIIAVPKYYNFSLLDVFIGSLWN